MSTAVACEPVGLSDHQETRVRAVVVAIPAAALLIAAVAGFLNHRYVLVAAAVVFGWSQLAGA